MMYYLSILLSVPIVFMATLPARLLVEWTAYLFIGLGMGNGWRSVPDAWHMAAGEIL